MSAGEIGRCTFVALLAMASCLVAPVAVLGASPTSDPAAELFDPGRMYVIELTLPPASEAELAKHPFEYQPGTFSIAETDGTPDGVGPFSTPVNVGVRLKGSASFRPLSGKSAFKVKFAKTELLHGLRILTLNSMVEDPSMIHETLAYTAYRGVDVPASRTGYAYVYVNDEDYGIHLNIETLDQIALEKLFGSFDAETQHLYESEYDADVTPEEFGLFEIDEGDEGDRGDLEALVAAVNSNGPGSWADRVAPVADLEEMTRMWAAEKYIGQWDGYAGMEASWLPNNYYLYSGPDGRFQMLPWGNDESWQAAHHLAFDGRAGLMFDRCIDDQACAAIYRESVGAVHQAVAGMDLDTLAVDTASMLAPWQELEDEESARGEHSLQAIEAKVAETRQFIATRPAEAAAWLALPPGTGTPMQTPALPTAGQGLAAGGQAPMRVARATVVDGTLIVQLTVPAAGKAALRAKVRTTRGLLEVCSKKTSASGSETVILRCRLSPELQRRRRTRWLRLAVTIGFESQTGASESLAHRIFLPRLGPR